MINNKIKISNKIEILKIKNKLRNKFDDKNNNGKIQFNIFLKELKSKVN